MPINKQKIILALMSKVKEDLAQAKSAYESAHQHATNEELVAEAKYDTRGIEAGYLAGAQKKRVQELEQELALLEEMDLEHTSQTIAVGSMAKIRLNEKEQLYFISSSGGGTILNINENPILVISAFSPIGAEAIGLEAGDSFELEAGGRLREYEIIEVF